MNLLLLFEFSVRNTSTMERTCIHAFNKPRCCKATANFCSCRVIDSVSFMGSQIFTVRSHCPCSCPGCCDKALFLVLDVQAFVDMIVRGCGQVAWLDVNSVPLTYDDRRVIDDSRFSVARSHVNEWNLQVRQVRDTRILMVMMGSYSHGRQGTTSTGRRRGQISVYGQHGARTQQSRLPSRQRLLLLASPHILFYKR